METHGGYGKLFASCYAHIKRGIVIEKDPAKATKLLNQRGQHWAVYQAENELALKAGLGSHLPVNFLDVAPWGDPWPTIGAFLASRRPRTEHLMIVVNDGLRHLLQRQGGWTCATLEPMVRKYGNADLYGRYLEVCREMMVERVKPQGYQLAAWTGYYAGQQMTHYAAYCRRSTPDHKE
jgi:hypothetical protein